MPSKHFKIMMSKEEVAQIMQYCKENGVTYKARLEELGIPRWRFFDSKTAYAREQAERAAPGSEFLQLTCGGDFVPTPSFAAGAGKGLSRKNAGTSGMLYIEMRTPNGTVMRIQGELTHQHLQSIIQAAGGHVQP